MQTEGLAVMCSEDPDNLLHKHKHFELGYLERGTARHILNGRETEIRAGDFFFMDFHSSHTYFGSPDCRVVNLLFLPHIIDPVLKDCTRLSNLVSHFLIHYLPRDIGRFNYQIFHDSDGEVLRLINRLAEESTLHRPGEPAMVRALMIQLLVTIMRQAGQEHQKSYSTLTQDILAIINEHYTENLTLRTIAARLNYAPAYLSRRFSDDVGQSFTDYLQSYRLELACHYLLTDQRSVAQIAESVGYKDVRFFYQLFRRTYYCTPSEFRKR